MRPRPCLTCGALTPKGSYCASCTTHNGWSPTRDRGKQARFRKLVLQRDGNRCRAIEHGERCPVTTDLRAAHIVALAKGGGYEPSNGVTLCKVHDRATDRRAR
jgi:hypothetical protein